MSLMWAAAVAPPRTRAREAWLAADGPLRGRVALVTGASRGIGRAVAEAMAAAGADVGVNYVSRPRLAEEVVRAAEKQGRRAIAVEADVSSGEQVQSMVERVVGELGRLDILVNNAGILSNEPFLELREATWDRVLAVNLKGQFLAAQAAAREMVRQGGGGRIVNVASIASGGVGVGFPGIAHYTASKGGVVALTESLAVELAPHGITVNAVAPGLVATDMTREAIDGGRAGAEMLRRIPLGRAGAPEDIAHTAVFLASDAAAYCTGATLYVDGGWLAA